jgi:hypothetical protein
MATGSMKKVWSGDRIVMLFCHSGRFQLFAFMRQLKAVNNSLTLRGTKQTSN